MDEFSLDETEKAALVDFWQRRVLAPRLERELLIFGRRLLVRSNDHALLAAVEQAVQAYSRLTPMDLPPLQVQLGTHNFAADPGPPPPDLMQQITYSGEGEWLLIHLAAWGHAYVDLQAGRATAVLSPSLAAQPDLVSQCLLHTILLNFIIASGFGYLHASCLVRQKQVVLLLGAHNVGKSTTALHLARAGWHLMTDSMVFVVPEAPLRIGGYPVATMKIRADVLAQFPQLAGHVTPEVVRSETKYRLECHGVAGLGVVETAVHLERFTLYLLQRGDSAETRCWTAHDREVRQAILQNSLFYDQQHVWNKNIAQLQRLLAAANCYHLQLGRDTAQLLAIIEKQTDII